MCDFYLFRILNTGVKQAPDLGSGAGTLSERLFKYARYGTVSVPDTSSINQLSHLMPYNSGSFSHSTLAGLRPGLLLRWTAPPPPRLLELEEPPLDASEPEDAAESLSSEPEEAATAP